MQNYVLTDKSRQKLIIYSIAFVSFMVSLDTYVVNISLPVISQYFNVGTGGISWVVLSYLLAVTSTLLVFGKIGDRIGFKKVFLNGFFVFTLGSLFCGVSPTLLLLVVSRLIQGIGGAMMLGMAPAMIPRFLPSEQRGTAFGYYATFAALGITVGTPLGGIITGFFSWHWIFLINIPIGIIAILVCNKTIPDDKPEQAGTEKQHFDVLGAVTSFLGSSLFLYGLNMGEEMGWTSFLVLSSFALSIIMLALFISAEKIAGDPLLDLSLFKNHAFTYGNIACYFAVSFQAGSNFLIPFYLHDIKGLEPQVAGLVFLTYSLVYMVGGLTAGRLSDKYEPRKLCTIAMISAALTSIGFAMTLHYRGFLPVIGFLAFLAVSYSLFIPANNNVVMGMAPEGKQGIVSGAYRMGLYLSLACGVGIYETIFSFRIPGYAQAGASHINIPIEQLISGFRYAYLAGGVWCICAVIFSLMAGMSRDRDEAIRC